MGHGSSKTPAAYAAGEEGSSGSSRMSRFRQRLRRVHRRRGSKSSRGCFKLVSADDFAGIALLTLLSGEMKFKDKWLACVSLGEQTFRTDISDQTDKPVWNSEKKFLLESNGPHVVRVSVYETNRLSKSNLVGFCDIDLLDYLTRDSDAEVVELLDPSTPNIAVGKLSFSCFVEDPYETEKDFVRKLLSIMDYDQDGKSAQQTRVSSSSLSRAFEPGGSLLELPSSARNAATRASSPCQASSWCRAALICGVVYYGNGVHYLAKCILPSSVVLQVVYGHMTHIRSSTSNDIVFAKETSIELFILGEDGIVQSVCEQTVFGAIKDIAILPYKWKLHAKHSGAGEGPVPCNFRLWEAFISHILQFDAQVFSSYTRSTLGSRQL